jgi:hypothetical protein
MRVRARTRQFRSAAPDPSDLVYASLPLMTECAITCAAKHRFAQNLPASFRFHLPSFFFVI